MFPFKYVERVQCTVKGNDRKYKCQHFHKFHTNLMSEMNDKWKKRTSLIWIDPTKRFQHQQQLFELSIFIKEKQQQQERVLKGCSFNFFKRQLNVRSHFLGFFFYRAAFND